MKHTSFLLSALLMAVTTAQAQKKLADQELDRASGTSVQVRSVFDPLPPSGYAPMRVVATNGTRRDARWRFDFDSQTSNYRQQNKHGSGFELDMPARSTQSALFLVPLAVGYGDRAYTNDNHTLILDISGTGFDGQKHYDNDNRVGGFPAVALSASLAEYSITALNKEVESKLRSGGGYYGGRGNLFGSQFEPDDLPDSWLGFSGFDYVLLSSTDWQKLKAPAKRALMEWVRFGGRLHVFVSPGVPPGSLRLPEAMGNKSATDLFSAGTTTAIGARDEQLSNWAFSLGRVQTFSWDGKKLPAAETVYRYWSTAKRVEDLTVGHTSAASWPLIGRLGTRSFASWQVMVFLVVFGILVGPVNLFVLAPAGKRHKLFVTTPLLSISASVVMVALILAQDGTGGIGRRFVAINIEPDDAAAYVTQEQVSRSGVLLSSGFQVKQPALIEPVAMPDTPWAKLKNNQLGQPADLTQEGSERRGNFFQSRAEQGQILRAAVSTRARVELKAGTAAGESPTLISALGFTVQELIYIDASGEHWMLKDPLATGQSAILVKTDSTARRARWDALCQAAENDLRIQITSAVQDQRSFFFAKAAKAPDFILETLPSVRWQDDQVVVFGPVAQP